MESLSVAKKYIVFFLILFLAVLTAVFIFFVKKNNLEQFNKDMDSQPIKNKVDNDVLSGQKADLNSTPTFYLNGNKLDKLHKNNHLLCNNLTRKQHFLSD